MKLQWKPSEGGLWKLLDQYKYVLIVIAVGILLLLWPPSPTGAAAWRRRRC